MLEKFGLLSVNQLAAKIKLVEVWKAVNIDNYPIKLEPYGNPNKEKTHALRPQTNRVVNDTCKLKKSEQSFNVDAARIWNLAPREITDARTLNGAKKLIDAYCKTLPV